MASPAEPILPPELERMIFEICAQSLPVFTTRLMLVARRVNQWVEPFLYRVICIGIYSAVPGFPLFTPENFASMMARKSPEFLRKAVRHFMIEDGSGYPSGGRDFLNICTEVEDLWLPYEDKSSVPSIQVLPLRRLEIDFSQFFRLPLSCKALSGLTHLALDDTPADYDLACTTFLALPKLTHLSFDGAFQFIRERVDQMLESLPLLGVMAAFAYDIDSFDHYSKWHITTDPRFVVLVPRPDFNRDWHSGARGGPDYWTNAENFVAKRRAGKIDPPGYMCECEWIY
ncbi:hypothetical protein R3P38DRAFT_2857193 [Favolaschia claudopus]|uniref:Uncharacterized protein n=1 Tax=Favolaschia claudopus TaxID=2862362 RepID=A0AAW0DL49_9AGAR